MQAGQSKDAEIKHKSRLPSEPPPIPDVWPISENQQGSTEHHCRAQDDHRSALVEGMLLDKQGCGPAEHERTGALDERSQHPAIMLIPGIASPFLCKPLTEGDAVRPGLDRSARVRVVHDHRFVPQGSIAQKKGWHARCTPASLLKRHQCMASSIHIALYSYAINAYIAAMIFEARSDLERLIAVADIGSVYSAAAHLGLTQPNLSRCVAKMEERAGTKFFERHRMGMRVTPAGALTVMRAREILRDIEGLEKELADLADLAQS